MSFYQPEYLECAYPIVKETIPKSSLGYGTNNKYPEFPPLMMDGRAVIGSWQPESTENQIIIEKNGIKSNWEYRRYLTQNSKDIQEYNFRESCNDAGYLNRPINIPSIQSNVVSGMDNTPFRFSSVLDNSRPVGYENSDLKEVYLSREQLNARKISPVVTQDEYLKKISK